MKYSVGTPLVQILGIADIGSDLIWLQCKPCNGCYKQIAPLFDPTRSRMYKEVSCSSSQCQSLKGTPCSGSEDSSCSYSMSYSDRSFSNGDLAVKNSFCFCKKKMKVVLCRDMSVKGEVKKEGVLEYRSKYKSFEYRDR